VRESSNAGRLLDSWESITRAGEVARAVKLKHFLKHAISQHSERTAVDGESAMTYAQIEKRADALAFDIGRSGMNAGSHVAIETDSAVNSAIALLGCYFADVVPVLVGVNLPESQLEIMLSQSMCAARINDELELYTLSTKSMIPVPDSATGYLVFTSGSTGFPKAVVVSERALLARLRALRDLPGLHTHDRMLSLTSINFDISLAELLLPMTVGAVIVAGDPSLRRDPHLCSEFMAEYRPSIVQATPSFWKLMLASHWDGSDRTTIWCGGETMTNEIASRLLNCVDNLWNLYGPSEATIWASTQRVTDSTNINLGKPLRETKMGVVDAEGRAVTLSGVMGQLWIGGAGLADGYFQNSESTMRAFVKDQLLGRRYLTGDLVSLGDNSELIFHGRSDDQVKIRGHRVELGHVEAILERCPGVEEIAVKLVERSDGRPQLEAYWVGPDAKEQELRQWARDHLIQPMRPARFSERTSLPRSRAGKIDKSLLRTEHQEC